MSKKLNPKYKAWRSELRRLAREAGVAWLLGNCDWTDHWRDGESPREAMQATYEDAGCPL